LTWRKLIPAIYNLHGDGWLEDRFAVIGVDLKPMDDDSLRNHLRRGVEQCARHPVTDETWKKFADHLHYVTANLGQPDTSAAFAKYAPEWGGPPQVIFYLAIAPSLIGTVVQQLDVAKFAKRRDLARVVIEKPFGRDLQSARELNRMLTRVFDESQIYRIDH